MSAIAQVHTPIASLFARAVLALTAKATAGYRRLVRAYQNRSDAAVLASLDDRMLADMGLTRSDVRDAFAEPFWHDPTSLLRARALERRLSRQHVSLGLKWPSPPSAASGDIVWFEPNRRDSRRQT